MSRFLPKERSSDSLVEKGVHVPVGSVLALAERWRAFSGDRCGADTADACCATTADAPCPRRLRRPSSCESLAGCACASARARHRSREYRRIGPGWRHHAPGRRGTRKTSGEHAFRCASACARHAAGHCESDGSLEARNSALLSDTGVQLFRRTPVARSSQRDRRHCQAHVTGGAAA